MTPQYIELEKSNAISISIPKLFYDNVHLSKSPSSYRKQVIENQSLTKTRLIMERHQTRSESLLYL